MWSRSEILGAPTCKEYKFQNNQVLLNSRSMDNPIQKSVNERLELMAEEPTENVKCLDSSSLNSFSILVENDNSPMVKSVESLQDAYLPAAPTTEGDYLLTLGQTEWMKVWANRMYQYHETSLSSDVDLRQLTTGLNSMQRSIPSMLGLGSSKVSEEVNFNLQTAMVQNRDRMGKNLDSSPILRNPTVTRTILPTGSNCGSGSNDGSELSRSIKINGRPRFEITKVRRNPIMPIHKRGNARPSPKPYGLGADWRSNSYVKRDMMVSPKAARVDSSDVESESEEHRRWMRKMRFENDSSVTSSDVAAAVERNISVNKKQKRALVKRTRAVVIDGTNVAYDYGENFCFDWEGILMCIKYFMDFGCDDITVVVPEQKLERGMTKNFHLVEQLKRDHMLMTCWENTNYKQFVAKTANRKNAVILSNTIWNQPKGVSSNLKHLTEKTLKFNFNTRVSPKNLVISERPFGPTGPTLDETLRL